MKKLEYLDENTGIECYPDYLAHCGGEFNYIKEIEFFSEIDWNLYEELLVDLKSSERNFSINLSSGKQNIFINNSSLSYIEVLNQIPTIEAFHDEDVAYTVYFVREGYTKEQSIADINLVADIINQDIKVLQSA